MMQYQVGALMFLKDDDPIFDDWEAAYEKAIAESYDDAVHAIFQRDKHGAELVALVYQQGCFER